MRIPLAWLDLESHFLVQFDSWFGFLVFCFEFVKLGVLTMKFSPNDFPNVLKSAKHIYFISCSKFKFKIHNKITIQFFFHSLELHLSPITNQRTTILIVCVWQMETCDRSSLLLNKIRYFMRNRYLLQIDSCKTLYENHFISSLI